MCGKSSSAPAPAPVAVPDPTIANRGSANASGVGQTKRIAGTEDGSGGISGGLNSSNNAAAPVAKSVLGG